MRFSRHLTSIAGGASWKLGADLVGRIFQYALLWTAARSLSQGDYGDLSFGLAVGLMLAQVADFGLQLFVQRELARLAIPAASTRPFFSDERAASRLVGGGLVIKGFLSAAALLTIGVVVMLEPVGNKGALILVGLSAVLGTALEYFSYCFRALGRLRKEALAILLARATSLLLGVAALVAGAGVLGIAVAVNLAMLLAIVYLFGSLHQYIRPAWKPDWAYWKRVLGQPTAIGIGMVFSTISFRVDNLLLPPLTSREAVGAYNVAYKLFEPSQMLPGVLLAATFPLMARSAAEWRQQRQGIFRGLLGQNLAVLLALSVGVTAGLYLLAAPVIHVLYGGTYQASIPVLQILAFAAVPMFTNYLLTHALIALDRPRLYALATLCGLAVNLAINLVLIPRLGIEGAAWATVLTEFVLLGLCVTGVVRSLGRRPGTERASEEQAAGLEILP